MYPLGGLWLLAGQEGGGLLPGDLGCHVRPAFRSQFRWFHIRCIVSAAATSLVSPRPSCPPPVPSGRSWHDPTPNLPEASISPKSPHLSLRPTKVSCDVDPVLFLTPWPFMGRLAPWAPLTRTLLAGGCVPPRSFTFACPFASTAFTPRNWKAGSPYVIQFSAPSSVLSQTP